MLGLEGRGAMASQSAEITCRYGLLVKIGPGTPSMVQSMLPQGNCSSARYIKVCLGNPASRSFSSYSGGLAMRCACEAQCLPSCMSRFTILSTAHDLNMASMAHCERHKHVRSGHMSSSPECCFATSCPTNRSKKDSVSYLKAKDDGEQSWNGS